MSDYNPDQDPDVKGEAVVWGWKLHVSPQAVPALVQTEEIIDKIVDKVLKQPELEELKPIRPEIKFTLKRHRKREQKIAEKWGTGVCLVSPWVMPTLLRPVKQHEDDTHMAWSAFDLGKKTWSESQLMTDQFRSETGPAVIGFDDRLFSVYRGAGDDSRLYYAVFQKNNDGSVDWSDPQPLGDHFTSDEPALAVLRGELFCFYNGNVGDTQIYYTKWTGNSWSGSATIKGLNGKAGPGAAAYNDEKIFVAAPGTDGHFWWAVYYGDGRWSQAYRSGSDTINLPPALVQHGGAVRVLYTGTDHCFFFATFTSDSSLGNPQKIPKHESKDGPSIVSYDGVLYAVCRGKGDDKIWFTYSKDDGRNWSPHTEIKAPGYLYSGKRPGLTTWRHSTGTRDQLLMLYRGAKV